MRVVFGPDFTGNEKSFIQKSRSKSTAVERKMGPERPVRYVCADAFHDDNGSLLQLISIPNDVKGKKQASKQTNKQTSIEQIRQN